MWVWELRENRPEPVPLQDQAWAWNLQEWAGPRDLCRYRHQYGTSEKVGLSQDLCRTNPKAGSFTGTFRETILSQQSRSWQAWDSKLYGSIANHGSAEQPPGTQSDQRGNWNHVTDWNTRSNHLSLESSDTWKIDHQSHRQSQLHQLEKKMSRQGKIICNTPRNTTTLVKFTDPITSRLEQPNKDEAEENDLKNNFRRMFEALKEEMQKFLKEMA